MPKQRKIDTVPAAVRDEAYAAFDAGETASAVWRRLLKPYMSRRSWQEYSLAHRQQRGAATLRDVLALAHTLAPKLTRLVEKMAALETWSRLRGRKECRKLSDSKIDEITAREIKRIWPDIRCSRSSIGGWRTRYLAMSAASDFARGAAELLGLRLSSASGRNEQAGR